MGELHAGGFKGITMQIEAGIRLDLPPAEFLCCAPVKGLQGRYDRRNATCGAAQSGRIEMARPRSKACIFQ
ncbi:MAG TPA: hypothetical protein VD713_03375 [Sphingomonadales bacterium]|nr:hypothetical protein [Sphingomonadales bacterium]